MAEKTNESSGNASNARVAELEKQNAELKAKYVHDDGDADVIDSKRVMLKHLEDN